jgi:hypothetical protein
LILWLAFLALSRLAMAVDGIATSRDLVMLDVSLFCGQ